MLTLALFNFTTIIMLTLALFNFTNINVNFTTIIINVNFSTIQLDNY